MLRNKMMSRKCITIIVGVRYTMKWNFVFYLLTSLLRLLYYRSKNLYILRKKYESTTYMGSFLIRRFVLFKIFFPLQVSHKKSFTFQYLLLLKRINVSFTTFFYLLMHQSQIIFVDTMDRGIRTKLR